MMCKLDTIVKDKAKFVYFYEYLLEKDEFNTDLLFWIEAESFLLTIDRSNDPTEASRIYSTYLSLVPTPWGIFTEIGRSTIREIRNKSSEPPKEIFKQAQGLIWEELKPFAEGCSGPFPTKIKHSELKALRKRHPEMMVAFDKYFSLIPGGDDLKKKKHHNSAPSDSSSSKSESRKKDIKRSDSKTSESRASKSGSDSSSKKKSRGDGDDSSKKKSTIRSRVKAFGNRPLSLSKNPSIEKPRQKRKKSIGAVSKKNASPVQPETLNIDSATLKQMLQQDPDFRKSIKELIRQRLQPTFEGIRRGYCSYYKPAVTSKIACNYIMDMLNNKGQKMSVEMYDSKGSVYGVPKKIAYKVLSYYPLTSASNTPFSSVPTARPPEPERFSLTIGVRGSRRGKRQNSTSGPPVAKSADSVSSVININSGGIGDIVENANVIANATPSKQFLVWGFPLFQIYDLIRVIKMQKFFSAGEVIPSVDTVTNVTTVSAPVGFLRAASAKMSMDEDGKYGLGEGEERRSIGAQRRFHSVEPRSRSLEGNVSKPLGSSMNPSRHSKAGDFRRNLVMGRRRASISYGTLRGMHSVPGKHAHQHQFGGSRANRNSLVITETFSPSGGVSSPASMSMGGSPNRELLTGGMNETLTTVVVARKIASPLVRIAAERWGIVVLEL